MNRIRPGRILRGQFARLVATTAAALGIDLRLWSVSGERVTDATVAGGTVVESESLKLAELCRERKETVEQRGPDGLPRCAVPILAGSGVAGVLTALPPPAAVDPASDAARPGGAAQSIRPFLEELAGSMTRQLELHERRRQVTDDLETADAELTLLRRVSARLSDPADTRGAFRFILEQGRVTLAAELGVLALRGTRTMLIARPPAPGAATLWPAPLVREANDRIAAQMERLHGRCLDGSLAEILGSDLPLPARAQLCACRLRLGNRRAGHLAYVRLSGLPFDGREITLLESLAEQASLALRSGELYDDLNQFLMSTVRALVSAVEAKDSYTSGHSVRVNVLAMLLGRQLGLPSRQLELLKWASILHDVGKIGMPEEILNKRGGLTAEEFDIVKQHPRRGYDVLSHIPQLRDAAQAVLMHHERIDGMGYPLGVAGDNIPLLARIIAVADTFDALTSTRPYRDAQRIEPAFAEIQRVAGRQLDAEIVSVFGEMVPFLKEHRVMLEGTRRAA